MVELLLCENLALLLSVDEVPVVTVELRLTPEAIRRRLIDIDPKTSLLRIEDEALKRFRDIESKLNTPDRGLEPDATGVPGTELRPVLNLKRPNWWTNAEAFSESVKLVMNDALVFVTRTGTAPV